MNRALQFLSLAVLLVGCAATGPNYASTQTSLPPVEYDHARIFFYRNSSYGGIYQPEITINGDPCGKAVPNGVFFKDVKPGTYKISTSLAQGHHVVLDLKPQDVVYVNLHFRIGFAVYPVLIESDEGQHAIQDLAYVQKP